jgi:hypothetical protein
MQSAAFDSEFLGGPKSPTSSLGTAGEDGSGSACGWPLDTRAPQWVKADDPHVFPISSRDREGRTRSAGVTHSALGRQVPTWGVGSTPFSRIGRIPRRASACRGFLVCNGGPGPAHPSSLRRVQEAMKRIFATVALALAIAFVLSSCGSSGSAASGAGSITTQARKPAMSTATPAAPKPNRAPARPTRASEKQSKARGQRLFERDCPVIEYGGPCAEGPMAFEPTSRR